MKPTIKMLIGLPASSKSTYAEKLKEQGFIVHSSDQLRIELYGDVNTFDKNGELFDELHRRIKADLMSGKNVCMDCTNISRKKRIHFLSHVLKGINCHKEAVIMATPYNMCIQSDKLREKKVGKEVIKRMYFNFQPPMLQEGFDSIKLEYHPNIDWTHPEYDGKSIVHFLTDMNQFNKYHTMTIGQHCMAVSCLIARKTDDLNLITAGYYHDTAKFKTMSFENDKGEFSPEAHYYQHHLVSTYDAMFYLKMLNRSDEDIIETMHLIAEHMQPHMLKEEKSINKYKQFVGEDFWNKLVILHEADKESR